MSKVWVADYTGKAPARPFGFKVVVFSSIQKVHEFAEANPNLVVFPPKEYEIDKGITDDQ